MHERTRKEGSSIPAASSATSLTLLTYELTTSRRNISHLKVQQTDQSGQYQIELELQCLSKCGGDEQIPRLDYWSLAAE